MATTYAIIGIVLLILEVALPGFVLLPIGIAFIFTAIVAFFVPTLEVTLIALAILAPLCFFGLRKLFKKSSKTTTPTNFDGLIGKQGIVEDEIPAGERGYVKVYGDSWKVEGLPAEALPKGSKVVIDHVEGTQIFVRKV
ncbi:MAG: NfeD family protein [Bdellovibrionota bacterium]